MPGRSKSAVYFVRPVTFAGPSTLGMGCPTGPLGIALDKANFEVATLRLPTLISFPNLMGGDRSSFYAEFGVHLVLKRKIEYCRCAQGIGDLSYLAIHFKKVLDLSLRNDAARREGAARYAIGLAGNREVHFQNLGNDFARAAFRFKEQPVCLSPRAENAPDQIFLTRKAFIANRQTALKKARKLIQRVC